MKGSRFLRPGLVILMFAALVLPVAALGDDDEVLRLRFDVSQDGNSFQSPGPFTNGFPAEGATFLVQGFIYPEGTLRGGTVSGTNPDGSPAFPTLGTWSCRGWFTQDDGNPAITGVVIVGTQVWEFDSEVPGAQTIVTDGVDLSSNEADLGVPFIRAITGGTGAFEGAGGEQTTINFGLNDSFGFDATHTLALRGLGGDDDDDEDD